MPTTLGKESASPMAGDLRACQSEVEMDTRIKVKPLADLRDYLAEERTFLAWIRTGIALMAFGFVVARFGISGTSPTSGNRPSPVSRTSSHSGLESRLSRSALS
jgi:uncharacterized membrane protein YidH (DUF202 family)